MKLISLKIHKADTCGGMLDGLFVNFRIPKTDTEKFDPLCLIGPNGSGKSQLLQVIAEIFQAIFCQYLPKEERGTPNDGLEFEIEYLIKNQQADTSSHVKAYRTSQGKRKAEIAIAVHKDGEWLSITNNEEVHALLPTKVVGYTSGDNETLSLPFFSSRAGYAEEVRTNALSEQSASSQIPDPRLLLIDYGTNLEVLVANLLLNPNDVKEKLLEQPNLASLRSFRCIIQLKHSAAPKDGVKLTQELQEYILNLKKCSTCYSYDEKHNAHTFDYFITPATVEAFESYWLAGALELYSCFHKLALLNDLMIPRNARNQFQKSIKNRRFAARLPEPFDEHKVFRFERVVFVSKKSGQDVDYVSLSDGEHQLAQLLGTACMVSQSNVLFLLDEPESHFNPRWRVEFIRKILQLPTSNGKREEVSNVAQQECLITTHSPFVPSDMQRDNVLIFNKSPESSSVNIRRPQIQTYGSKFDAILAECFDISPPISALSREYISGLLADGTAQEIEQALSELGESSARMQLAARLMFLEDEK